MNRKMIRLAFTGKWDGLGASGSVEEFLPVAPPNAFLGALWPKRPASATMPKPAPAFLSACRRETTRPVELGGVVKFGMTVSCCELDHLR